MKDRDAIQFLLGAAFGAVVVTLVMANINADAVKAAEIQERLANICFMTGSTPKEYDSSGELICENGASFNYSDFE